MNENDAVEVELSRRLVSNFICLSVSLILVNNRRSSLPSPDRFGGMTTIWRIFFQSPSVKLVYLIVLSSSYIRRATTKAGEEEGGWLGGRNEMKWNDEILMKRLVETSSIAQVRRGDLLVCSILSTISPPFEIVMGGGLMVEWIHGWDSCVCVLYPYNRAVERESGAIQRRSAGQKCIFIYKEPVRLMSSYFGARCCDSAVVITFRLYPPTHTAQDIIFPFFE